jgi:hypothetical protein
MEYRDTLFGPLYATWGRPARLVLDTGQFDITAIDLTAGQSIAGIVDVETTGPSAVVLAGDLADLGVLTVQLEGGSVILYADTAAARSWAIRATRARPSPFGPLDGETILLLEGTEG